MTELTLEYKGIQKKITSDGITTTVRYIGTEELCNSALADVDINSKHDTYGYLREASLQQGDGGFCTITYTYSTATNKTATPPKTEQVYGEKSATLYGACLQVPLEQHTNYLTCWNHYLFGTAGTSLPGWHASATDTITDTPTMVWGKSLSDRPDGYIVLAQPTKPGVTHYEVATYRVTEIIKQRTHTKAGEFVAGKLNKITTPGTTFGITGGNWKCDDANVVWRDRAWYATLTYTLSGDSAGWDPDLYSA